MAISAIRQIDIDEFETIAHMAGITIPVEQSRAWDDFDAVVPGREIWNRFAWQVDGQDVALISLTKLAGRGFKYLWAKHGPVWLAEPTPARQRAFRSDLVRAVRGLDHSIAFVRLHADDGGADLHELLQSVTYDRTIILDLRLDDDARMASMKKRGRRDVRKALRDESLVVANETARAAEIFDELYAILVETGERDSFGILPASTYTTMLEALGEHARLYTVRRENRALCWGIVTVNDGHAQYYYAGSNEEGRKAGGPDLLVWSMAKMLREEGIESFDLMGIDSERAPQLVGVRGFKTKFTEKIIEVPGAWDVPVRSRYYQVLTAALKTKRTGVARVRDLKGLILKR